MVDERNVHRFNGSRPAGRQPASGLTAYHADALDDFELVVWKP
jgi:hypothetical protein